MATDTDGTSEIDQEIEVNSTSMTTCSCGIKYTNVIACTIYHAPFNWHVFYWPVIIAYGCLE